MYPVSVQHILSVYSGLLGIHSDSCVIFELEAFISILRGAFSGKRVFLVGVNVLDQMARLYSVKGGTCCWPVAVFYNMLDLAAINAHVLLKQCMRDMRYMAAEHERYEVYGSIA
jgi:hypothetical protein